LSYKKGNKNPKIQAVLTFLIRRQDKKSTALYRCCWK